MSTRIKELIVILTIAALIFRLAKPIAVAFCSESHFRRRRNVWFALTISAFLSPNFWLYAFVAIPLIIWASKKDDNPVALYVLLLQVIPTIPIDIPVVGIQHLFPLDNYRVLSFCILIPAAWRLRRSPQSSKQIHGLGVMDILLFSYGALEIAFFSRPDLANHLLLEDSATNMLRRGFLFFVDVYVLYYVVSRSSSTRGAINETLSAFCIACGLMSAFAVFEAIKRWLLYAELGTTWSGYAGFGFYLLRGDTVRAQASAGHPLALGYLIAISYGFWLYLKTQVHAPRRFLLIDLLFWLGLIAAYSRGPWIGAAVIYFTFTALGPRRLSRFLKSIAVVALITAAVGVTPLGNRIIRVLPFMGGSIDSGSIDYRQQVLERSWELIQQHLFFGDQFFLSKMESLRQGQGIIDIVNTYLEIALGKGLVGLSLFLGFILIALIKAYGPIGRLVKSDPGLALFGACLVACITGTLLMIENCSFIFGYEKMFYILAALAAAYAHLSWLPPERSPAGTQNPPLVVR